LPDAPAQHRRVDDPRSFRSEGYQWLHRSAVRASHPFPSLFQSHIRLNIVGVLLGNRP